MTKSIFGLFTALLCWISIVIAIQCFRKKRWGPGSIVFTQCFYEPRKYNSRFFWKLYFKKIEKVL